MFDFLNSKKPILKFTGERVVPDDMLSNDITLLEHLARYDWASFYCKNKIVLDCACGSGYGTKMLKADGFDVSAEAVAFAKSRYGVNARVCDLEYGLCFGFWDIIVSFETIEHLEYADNFLQDVSTQAKQFIFSIPLNNPSAFHKKVYTLEEAKALIARYFNQVQWFEQTGVLIRSLQSESPTFLIGIANNYKND